MFSFLFQDHKPKYYPVFLYHPKTTPSWKLSSFQPTKHEECTLVFKKELFDLENKDPSDYYDWSFLNKTYPLDYSLQPFRQVSNANVYMYVIPLGFFLLSHFVAKNK